MKRTFTSIVLLLFLAHPVGADEDDAAAVSVRFELLETKHFALKIMVSGKGT